ncbi:hypothetical protein JG688_00002689 [Phytophthora aleatoria]|uniref:Uncharacterized protein n=1 Tax=Phytophthora aleatoria TaxID=2496075 RepID=A0A8J5J0E5_9STRA|nr:hypothetical protein JG688_00002689 [Phytophthora aleatoria]
MIWSLYNTSAALGRALGSIDTQACPSSTIDGGLISENSTLATPVVILCRRAASVSWRPVVSKLRCFACAYGSVCISSSDSTTPNENISALSSYISPIITSGAIHSDVPTPAVIVWSRRSLEIPKSVTLASIAWFSKMLRDFRSR